MFESTHQLFPVSALLMQLNILFSLLYTKLRALKLRIFFQSDSFPVTICSFWVFYENISILFQNSYNMCWRLSSSLHYSISGSKFHSYFSIHGKSLQCPCCTPSSVFVSLAVLFCFSNTPPSSHLIFPKIWRRGQEHNHFRNKWLHVKSVSIEEFSFQKH